MNKIKLVTCQQNGLFFNEGKGCKSMMSGLIKNILLLFALCAFCITTYAQLEKYTAVSASDLDRYGGYQGLSFEAKGYFYLLHDGYRYWLVTPDGNAFISYGVNHLERKWMQRFYNIDYWARKNSITDYSDRKFNEAFLKKASEDIEKIGWNTLGCHNPINYGDSNPYINLIPYVKTIRFVNIHHARPNPSRSDFPDVWSSDFYNHCDQLAKNVAGELKNDPYLLGYFMTDCPILTEKDAAERGNIIYSPARPASPTWPQVIRNMTGDMPGKQKYVDHVKFKYNNSIKALMGDASVHVPYKNLPDPFGPQSANQQARIEDVKTLYLNAFKRDDFLGWHWCGWMDDWEASGNAGKQHGGIQDPFGNFHPVAEFLSEFSKKMYYIVLEGDE
ncbi:MAG: hypothetical protein ACOCXH_07590 [Cyclobacteriaceae bacterium]